MLNDPNCPISYQCQSYSILILVLMARIFCVFLWLHGERQRYYFLSFTWGQKIKKDS